MRPVAFVSNDVREKKDAFWGGDVSRITLAEGLGGAFDGLADFSHAVVLYHLDRAEFVPGKHTRRRPQNRDDMPLVGIFSQRGKDRPNRIGMTAVKVLSVEGNTLTVQGLDALDGTAVLDVKPYYPAYDRRDADVPEWVSRLMERYF